MVINLHSVCIQLDTVVSNQISNFSGVYKATAIFKHKWQQKLQEEAGEAEEQEEDLSVPGLPQYRGKQVRHR
ncbi:hypothetical protein SKAU_G00089710, partial [Synaphobranchus kaupii]